MTWQGIVSCNKLSSNSQWKDFRAVFMKTDCPCFKVFSHRPFQWSNLVSKTCEISDRQRNLAERKSDFKVGNSPADYTTASADTLMPKLSHHRGRVTHYNDVIMGTIASQITSLTCLLNGLFRRRSKKTSKLRVTGLCAGNSPGTGEFPAQTASNA